MSQNNEAEQPVETNNIYQAMANVMLDIEAIGKDALNKQQGFDGHIVDGYLIAKYII